MEKKDRYREKIKKAILKVLDTKQYTEETELALILQTSCQVVKNELSQLKIEGKVNDRHIQKKTLTWHEWIKIKEGA